ncbi:MAG: hypothetical protein M1819_000500 [Sarea resinae]|nr:MAG: hypothetical protein M1819_000500 [Sarea resinae]
MAGGIILMSPMLPSVTVTQLTNESVLFTPDAGRRATREETTIKRAGGDPSGWSIPSWTLDADKAINNVVGTATTILSLTAPGAPIEKDTADAARLARQANEYAAKLRDDEPTKYGFFAALPSIVDTKESLEEIAYALDVLKADGVTLFTRYGEDSYYLGHPSFRPIWAELNSRKAVVFVHPTHVDLSLVNEHLPQPMLDYPHETCRTAMDLIVNNNIKTYPDCKIILSHAGGTLPYLIYRAAAMLPYTPCDIGKSTQEIVEEGRSFYFDTAISSNKYTLELLFAFAKPGHILFGSDFPNAPTESIEYFTSTLEELWGDHREIERDAALAILPRLRQKLTG